MNAYLIFKRMGLIAYNMDVGPWTTDLTQGMRNFKPEFDPSAGGDVNLRFVDIAKAMDYLCIRASYQMAGMANFMKADNAPLNVPYS